MSTRVLPNAGKGRVKGVPNKTSGNVREMIARMAETTAEDFEFWLKDVAQGISSGKPDPARAAELYLKAIEYHIPKLARTEVSGDQDKPVKLVVTWE